MVKLFETLVLMAGELFVGAFVFLLMKAAVVGMGGDPVIAGGLFVLVLAGWLCYGRGQR